VIRNNKQKLKINMAARAYEDIVQLNRSSELRNDITYLKNAFNKDYTKFIIFKNCLPLVEKVNEKITLCITSGNIMKDVLNTLITVDMGVKWPDNLLFMGIENKGKENALAWFAIHITDEQEVIIHNTNKNSFFIFNKFKFISMLNDYKSILTQAKSMFHWLDRYRYCATCGNIMITEEAGYKRTCSVKDCRSNKGVHNTCYPRSDPTVIMCISTKDHAKCLLGRKAAFPHTMYSCLAGFIEAGEVVEDAVVRETKEESGIDVSNVTYDSSQSWPFPSTLMIGCFALAESHDITICKEEMEDVKWFSRDQIMMATRGESNELMLPPIEAIARQLIETWVKNTPNENVKSSL